MKLLSNRRRQCFRRFIDGVGGCKKAQKLIETIRMTSKKKTKCSYGCCISNGQDGRTICLCPRDFFGLSSLLCKITVLKYLNDFLLTCGLNIPLCKFLNFNASLRLGVPLVT